VCKHDCTDCLVDIYRVEIYTVLFRCTYCLVYTYLHELELQFEINNHVYMCKYMLTQIYVSLHRCLQCPFEMGDGGERTKSDTTYVDIYNVYLKQEILCGVTGVTVVTVGALSASVFSTELDVYIDISTYTFIVSRYIYICVRIYYYLYFRQSMSVLCVRANVELIVVKCSPLV